MCQINQIRWLLTCNPNLFAVSWIISVGSSLFSKRTSSLDDFYFWISSKKVCWKYWISLELNVAKYETFSLFKSKENDLTSISVVVFWRNFSTFSCSLLLDPVFSFLLPDLFSVNGLYSCPLSIYRHKWRNKK